MGISRENLGGMRSNHDLYHKMDCSKVVTWELDFFTPQNPCIHTNIFSIDVREGGVGGIRLPVLHLVFSFLKMRFASDRK